MGKLAGPLFKALLGAGAVMLGTPDVWAQAANRGGQGPAIPKEEDVFVKGPIDGRLEPERIPDWTVWDHFLALLESMSEGTWDAAHPKAVDFVRGNVYISRKDATILFEIARKAQTQLNELRRQNDFEFEAELGLKQTGKHGPLIRQARIKEIEQGAHDEAMRRLSPLGAKAVVRFLAIFKQGIYIGKGGQQ